MTLYSLKQLKFGGSLAALVFAVWPQAAVGLETTATGVFALPGVTQKVIGEMTVIDTGPLSRKVELVFSDKRTGEPVREFDEELTQELHILATDAALSTLVHEHVKEAGPDGRFTAELEFPKPGLYHVYTDAVPSGFGQQVLRFNVPVNVDAEPSATGDPANGASSDAKSGGALEASDGPYSVSIDASQLRSGAEGTIRLSIRKDGQPATDLAPYLGVPAHAVFVRAEDLAYVHAHPTSAAEGGAKGQDAHAGHGGHGGQASHGSHAGHAAAADEVSPDMMLQVTPPGPGRYALWIEFIGGEEVRTVPFSVDVPGT